MLDLHSLKFHISPLIYLMLFLTLIPSISPTHSDDSKSPLTVCTSLKSGKQFISKTGGCNERIYETRDWYGEGAVPTGTPGSRLIALNLCTSIKSQIRLIREKCNPRTQLSDTYQRSYGPPAAPLVPSATADLLGSAFLSFDEPEVDGGALISSYTITSTPGAITSLVAPKDINRAKITGLTPGVTYRFSITATNSQGTSLASPSSEAMLAPNLPDAPSITSLILTGDNSARLHYDQTKFDGGAAISSYKATITSSGIVVATRQLSPGVLELTGLPYSTTLSISLSARNIAGSSIASNASNSITTATPPPPPPPEPEPSPTPSSSAAPSPSAPAFTLSSSTEDVTVNTAATGFTITSTGGVIASFAISPAAPAGMSFNTSTGAFSGTPTATQSATTYTITATNATGSATQTFSFTVSAAVISVAAIGGVTAPVKDATPVTTVTAANGYTGTVTWSGSPTTFAAVTTYTATITLTADDGYTITGVSENFFTVAGATSVTHSANSGVITAVFPATEFYAIGGTGPGGGTIFYVAETDFNCGPSLTLSCRYLEAAPITGSTAWTDAGYQWSGNVSTSVNGALQTGIGTGYSNTLAIVAQSSTAERAATKAQSYRGPNNLSDWYLPSQNELYQMLGIVPLDGRYWTSTQYNGVSGNARLYIFNISISPNTASLGGGGKTQLNKVRPIRAFGGP
ncbi:MAG: hypothetical protein ABR62_02655 [Actinobacteria bacterium BACL2 MAG-120820-bin50]|uniref:Fibronectin type-III domain-containing protein n=2 Tax=ac1 cluster TaxID=1655545 RepID=A0A0R2QQF2_9ACTN|nr:MAG: hypothetical protein ABR62_02655 [Actinobacteria bacterium BACL2 MAG-120820-bin50]